MNNFSGGGYTRINKTRARNLFNAGETIYLLPVKMGIAKNLLWYMPAAMVPEKVNGSYLKTVIDDDGKIKVIERTDCFDCFVNEYEHYNCYSETGNYAAFYILDAGE